MTETPLIGLIPLFPLLGAILNGAIALYNARPAARLAGGWRIPDRIVSWIGVSLPLLAAAAALAFAGTVLADSGHGRGLTASYGTWFSSASGGLDVHASLLLDELSVVMVLVVAGIGSLIHLYSVGYLAGDKGYARYFAYLNLFLFSMLVLVMARDLVLMFVGWEGVGLCSYLLIGFWFDDRAKAAAGLKAFVVNRIGDLGFLLGLFLLWWTLRPFGLQTFDLARLPSSMTVVSVEVATAIAVLLFVGATGKSAQIPLHVWLPDAMAGPTPVSALIHAATMVTAGVYMVSRMAFLFEISDLAPLIVGTVGGATALVAATVACTQTNIKRVVAWSTVSQLGYMFLALGAGAYGAGMFHLVSHAFFKGLFFLSAGAVIHALHGEEDLAKMGGLWPKLRWTAIAFGIAAMANAGLPPLSGFVSKDAILVAAWGSEMPLFGILGFVTALLTAFYSTRLLLLVFAGAPRDPGLADRAHEPPLAMGLPMAVLAAGAVVVGILDWPRELGGHEPFTHFLTSAATFGGFQYHPPEHAIAPVALSVAIVLAGIGAAWLRYGRPAAPIGTPWPALGNWWAAAQAGWGFDTLFERVILRPLFWLGQAGFAGTDRFIDRATDFVARAYDLLARTLRPLQNGLVRSYGYAMLAGLLLLILAASAIGRPAP
ncbi:MAG: NADH-quinone oxidoreductase subunit L [Candidatus Sericytochromatia bacterium]|nr:NADH-quinone oxidoreductase subunit L [Candidatus Tanganyikabacteria bacterium]